jgi:hypothetical protein
MMSIGVGQWLGALWWHELGALCPPMTPYPLDGSAADK